MSLENAKKLVSELMADDELRKRFAAGPEAALAEKNYGCTAEELKEALVLSRELDADELEAVAGGQAHITRLPRGNGASSKGEHYGKCTGTFFVQECAATVENGSTCWTNDWCMIWDVVYDTKR